MERHQARFLALALPVLPVLVLLSGLAMAPLVAVLTLVLWGLGGWRMPRGGLDLPTLLAGGLLLAWSAASALWAPDIAFALKTTASLAAILLAATLLLAELRRLPAARLDAALSRLAIGLAIAFMVMILGRLAYQATVLLATDAERVRQVFRIVQRDDRGATAAVLLLWPALSCLLRGGRRRAALGLLALALVGVVCTFDLAAKVALLLGILAVAGSRLAPRLMPAAVLGAVLLAMLGAPLAAGALPSPEANARLGLPTSLHHRLTIWRYVAGRIDEHPWLGFGMESARTLGESRSVAVTFPDGNKIDEELLPLHPHDGPLQIRLELGLPGALLAAGFIALLCRRLIGRPGVGVGVLTGGFLIAAVSYGVWQSWWLLALVLAGSLSAAVDGKREVNSSSV
jgi:O-antigen ligase